MQYLYELLGPHPKEILLERDDRVRVLMCRSSEILIL